MSASLSVGLTGEAKLVVTAADTAIALGSGDVPVLGTPRLVALCEQATVTAVHSRLDSGQTTVGTHVEFDHLAASGEGVTVVARARLVDIDGRRLTFEVTANEGERTVGRGRIGRVVVDRARFLSA